MAGEFFALIDEGAGSERRLDDLAKPILEKTAELEKRAAQVIEAKHAKLDAAIDYVDRLEKGVSKLEASEKPTNGGPTVEGSADSPQPSPELPKPSPVAPVVPPVVPDHRPERQPSDYKVTNGPGA